MYFQANALSSSISNIINTALPVACTKEQPATLATPVLPAALLYEHRFKMYQNRYRYQPPVPYVNANHEKQAELCGVTPNFKAYFKRGFMDRSANKEDLTMYNLFFKSGENETESKGKGSIVEMGAFDGIRESNSRFFDHCLGWDTLLIEGAPNLFDKVVKNRPHAHRFNYVPCCTEAEELVNKTILFDNIIFTNGGMAEGPVNSIYHNKGRPKVDVPCGSLTKVLLDVFPNGHISFFSLDVEGAEPLVLEQLDFDKVYIETMIVENRNAVCPVDKCASRDKFRKILTESGFIMFDDVVIKSDLYIHPLSEHLQTAKKKGLVPRLGKYPESSL